MPTGLLQTKRGEEESSGRWWHLAHLHGSPGPLDLAGSPAPKRCEPGSQPHQKLAAGRPPVAPHLHRSQLSRTRCYKPHRYRPLLTRLSHGALKNIPGEDWPDSEGKMSCCRAIKCICASHWPLCKEHPSHYADKDPARVLRLQWPTAFFPSRVRPSVLRTHHNHTPFILRSLPTLHVCLHAPSLARVLNNNNRHEVSCQNVLGRGN